MSLPFSGFLNRLGAEVAGFRLTSPFLWHTADSSDDDDSKGSDTETGSSGGSSDDDGKRR